MSNQETPPVWVLFPTANPKAAHENGPLWKSRGYKVAVLQDCARFDCPWADIVIAPNGYEYRGYAASIAQLCTHVPPECIVVLAGDDMQPDPKKSPSEIAAEYFARFPDGDGVMQPTGDTLDGTDRICGSPWVGPKWRALAHGGNCPQNPAYFHFYADEEMFEVAKARGLLYQNPGVTQFHDHWTRPEYDGTPKAERPKHQDQAFFNWDRDKATFQHRKSLGFPGVFADGLSDKPLGSIPMEERKLLAVVWSRGDGPSIGLAARLAQRFADKVVVLEFGPFSTSAHSLALLRNECSSIDVVNRQPYRPTKSLSQCAREAIQFAHDYAVDQGQSHAMVFHGAMLPTGEGEKVRAAVLDLEPDERLAVPVSHLISTHYDRAVDDGETIPVAFTIQSDGRMDSDSAPEKSAAFGLLNAQSIAPNRWREFIDCLRADLLCEFPDRSPEGIVTDTRRLANIREMPSRALARSEWTTEHTNLARLYLRPDSAWGASAVLGHFKAAYGTKGFVGLGILSWPS